MGTNYYLQEATCEHCGRGADKLHIGKSSGGWCFSLHVIPEIGLNDLSGWKARWSKPGAAIADEYGETVTPAKMESVICDRSWNGSKQILDGRWYEINHAEPGPNGLARSLIGKHCAGHGSGTYDLITGDFS